jgi:hypothetical protein
MKIIYSIFLTRLFDSVFAPERGYGLLMNFRVSFRWIRWSRGFESHAVSINRKLLRSWSGCDGMIDSVSLVSYTIDPLEPVVA